MTYVIAEPCVDLLDKSCIEECPVDCIYEGNRMLNIHPDECVDCGACEPVCPVEAIFYEDDTPEQWKDYYKANVEFFDDLGSPGGASKTGKIDKDHPFVAALPPMGEKAAGETAEGVIDLPDFPWDILEPYAEKARSHPDGVVNLSVGTPVDATPDLIQRALSEASDAPGYPLTAGTPELRAAIAGWFERRFGAVVGSDAVLPVIGTKELVAWLPTLLAAKSVGYPALAYPTYDVGARLAGAEGMVVESTVGLGPQPLDLLWLNSPANPTGRVLPAEHLRKVVDWARRRGTVVASDECYADLYYDAEPPVSVLSPSVCGDSHEGLLAVHSMSKRSNLAGYRAGYVAGDPALVARLREVRKHAGMIVPAPVQAAMVAALGDDDHVAQQRSRYAARRTALLVALQAAGFAVDDSTAGLYLWATRGERCWDTVDWLAQRGVLVAPGEFYGAAGARHVRVALTATDERVAAAVARLSAE